MARAPILWPFNEVHVLVLGRGNSPTHTVLCNDNDVGPGEDRIHILHVIDTAEGGLNEPHLLCLHVCIDFVVHGFVIGVVARLSACTLVKLGR